MADQKITALTSLAQADIVSGTDVLPIVDVGSPSVTKKATPKAVVGASVNDLAQTWNNVATTFTAIKMNATDTASASGSALMDLQVGGVSQFKVGKSGIVTAKAQVGTITNDNAAAGEIGEYVVSNIPFGSAVSVTSATNFDLTSISLTAGDWDVSGNVFFIPAGTTVPDNYAVSVNDVSATRATLPEESFLRLSFIAGVGTTLAAPIRRFSLASTTTIFLVVRPVFTVSTMTACGFIRARRAR